MPRPKGSLNDDKLMQILRDKSDSDAHITYTNDDGKTFTTGIDDIEKVMASNKLFDNKNIAWYRKFNRYGYIDPYSHEDVLKEFLFFTKPDLNIFRTVKGDAVDLIDELKTNPYFYDVYNRNKSVLYQLQRTGLTSSLEGKLPFMNLLSNSVTSKLDLPGISAENDTTTQNLYGTEISIRSHSLKSDNGCDFSLSFTDTAYLEVYTLAKIYDEYIRLMKTGRVAPFDKYIRNDILSDQFSIYKFLIGADGETIMYYAKITGVYIVDVPRSDFSDPSEFGKFSLNFHGQFVEDNNPFLITEFNTIVANAYGGNFKNDIGGKLRVLDIYNGEMIDNEWGTYPFIVKSSDMRAKRRSRGDHTGGYYDYRLKWCV